MMTPEITAAMAEVDRAQALHARTPEQADAYDREELRVLRLLAEAVRADAGRAGRYATINRAIALIDTAPAADLARWLAATSLHEHVKADPARLRRHLAGAGESGSIFGAWKAAQQLLQAAGQPY